MRYFQRWTPLSLYDIQPNDRLELSNLLITNQALYQLS